MDDQLQPTNPIHQQIFEYLKESLSIGVDIEDRLITIKLNLVNPQDCRVESIATRHVYIPDGIVTKTEVF